MCSKSTRKSATRLPPPPVRITVSPNTPSPDWSSGDDEGPHSSVSSQHQNSMSSQTSSSSSRSPSAKSWVDYGVPKCVDFGIQDFLCRMDEEFDCSSDTDTSYLDATPPHRFSDGEVERIDPIPVILNTILKDDNVYMDSHQHGCISDLASAKNKSPSNSSLIIFHVPSAKTTTSEPSNSRNRPRPFRRNFSLPAAFFTARLASNRIDPLKIDSAVVSSGSSSSRKLRASLPYPDFTVKCTSSSAAASTSTPVSDVFLPTWESVDTPQQSDTSVASAIDPPELCEQMSQWSLDEVDDFQDSDDSSAFTTDIEQKSLRLRSRRRLVRQDTTTGNVAPADFHI